MAVLPSFEFIWVLEIRTIKLINAELSTLFYENVMCYMSSPKQPGFCLLLSNYDFEITFGDLNIRMSKLLESRIENRYDFGNEVAGPTIYQPPLCIVKLEFF